MGMNLLLHKITGKKIEDIDIDELCSSRIDNWNHLFPHNNNLPFTKGEKCDDYDHYWRPAEFDKWRKYMAAKVWDDDQERYLQLLSIMESDPDTWLMISY